MGWENTTELWSLLCCEYACCKYYRTVRECTRTHNTILTSVMSSMSEEEGSVSPSFFVSVLILIDSSGVCSLVPPTTCVQSPPIPSYVTLQFTHQSTKLGVSFTHYFFFQLEGHQQLFLSILICSTGMFPFIAPASGLGRVYLAIAQRASAFILILCRRPG